MLLAEPYVNEVDDMYQLEGANLLNSYDYLSANVCEPSSKDEMGIDFGESHSSTYKSANKGNGKSNYFVRHPDTKMLKAEPVENNEKILTESQCYYCNQSSS